MSQTNSEDQNPYMIINRLTKENEALRESLPDSLYPGSKDYISGGASERIEWLKTMYEATKSENNRLYETIEALQEEGINRMKMLGIEIDTLREELAATKALVCSSTLQRNDYFSDCVVMAGFVITHHRGLSHTVKDGELMPLDCSCPACQTARRYTK